jgi:hypothetical protein
LQPEYVWQVMKAELKHTPSDTHGKLVETFTVDFPFQVRPTRIPQQLTWSISYYGQVCRVREDHDNGNMISNGSNLRILELPDRFMPLNAFKGLRPCLVHFVLRYLMIACLCDSPILESLFEFWPGERNEWHDGRLFPKVKLPRYYQNKSTETTPQFEVIY